MPNHLHLLLDCRETFQSTSHGSHELLQTWIQISRWYCWNSRGRKQKSNKLLQMDVMVHVSPWTLPSVLTNHFFVRLDSTSWRTPLWSCSLCRRSIRLHLGNNASFLSHGCLLDRIQTSLRSSSSFRSRWRYRTSQLRRRPSTCCKSFMK